MTTVWKLIIAFANLLLTLAGVREKPLPEYRIRAVNGLLYSVERKRLFFWRTLKSYRGYYDVNYRETILFNNREEAQLAIEWCIHKDAREREYSIKDRLHRQQKVEKYPT